MVRHTPQQGLSYPQRSDSPAQVAAVTRELLGQLDTWTDQLDADVNALLYPAYVRISVTGTGLAAGNKPQSQFDTVEANRGTLTDLAAYRGLDLPTGMWAWGALYLWDGTVGVTPGFEVNLSGANGDGALAKAVTYDQAPVGTSVYGGHQGLVLSDLVYVFETHRRFTVTWSEFGTLVYAALWAFRIGEA